MHILVTGAAGRLGSKLTAVLRQQGHQITGVDVVGEAVTHLDITDFQNTRSLIHDLKPDLILHPAAWTDVDGCAREPEKAIQINGLGTQHIALAAARINAPLLYISSNEVFEGQSGSAYYEYDRTAPANPYAYSKWVGEQAVLTLHPKHYLVRTAWLFAHGGKNFIQAILSAAEAGKALRVVTDEVANPTYNDDLVHAITRLITTERYGIYHFVNHGSTSRYAFARYILDHTAYREVPIQPITSREWQRASVPPPYTALHNLNGTQIGITLRPWQQAVDAFLQAEGVYQPT
jgi:dTDP-4-dehydrorhamnose reductase